MKILTALGVMLALASASEEPTFTPAQRAYWAWQPPRAAAPPSAAVAVENPIDSFLLAKLEAAGLDLAAEADKAVLLRRGQLDLLGLAPNFEEIQAFAADARPDAWEHKLEEFLQSPHYGERLARAWLDLVRYADSDGYKADVYRPSAWRYRDYVVRSFNADKPYDRFVQEQLAGDELYPHDADALIATGYLRLWPYEDNQIDVKSQWDLILSDVTEVTSEAFLGLGLKCAKCHDHKYDPLPQADYYRLQAFFAGIMPKTDESLNPPALTKAQAEKMRPWEEATASIRAEIDKLWKPLEEKRRQSVYNRFPDYLKRVFDKDPGELTALDRQMILMGNLQIINRGGKMEMKGEAETRRQELAERLKQFDHLKPPPLPTVMGVVDVAREAPPTTFGQGKKQREVAPGFLSILAPGPAKIEAPADNPDTSGRRSALARWLTQANHPLTARVIVNRVWQRHFGAGLVATANDFGKQGAPPTHPELLDWLAVWFVDNGWSFKKLDRLIMTSRAYRQSALRAMPQAAEHADPENKLLWRMPSRRMEAEEIRDSMLATTGELDRRLGGEGVKDGPRRSLYLRNIRNTYDEFLRGFDAADMFNSCSRRDVTSTPLQSLMLMNGEWIMKRAESAAKAIHDTEPSAFVRAAYQRILAREPKGHEMAKALGYLSRHGGDKSAARRDFCHVLLNTNEFLFVD